MKKIIVLLTTFVGLFLVSSASFAETNAVKKELLQDLKEEAKKCVSEIVKTTDSKKEVVGYESACQTFKIVSMHQVQIFIDGEWLTATIEESALSDDGDLDNLYITNSANQVIAQKLNVAAYDSVVSAIVGSETELTERQLN